DNILDVVLLVPEIVVERLQRRVDYLELGSGELESECDLAGSDQVVGFQGGEDYPFSLGGGSVGRRRARARLARISDAGPGEVRRRVAGRIGAGPTSLASSALTPLRSSKWTLLLSSTVTSLPSSSRTSLAMSSSTSLVSRGPSESPPDPA